MPPAPRKSPSAPTPGPVSISNNNLLKQPRQVPFKSVLRNDPFGTRVIVTIEPRTVEYPSWEFPTYAEGMAFAEELQRVHGWPISDRCQYAPD